MGSLLAILALVAGVSSPWLASENIAGNEEPSLHLGNVLFVTIAGVIAFSLWRWPGVFAVLGSVGVWWITAGIFQRRLRHARETAARRRVSRAWFRTRSLARL